MSHLAKNIREELPRDYTSDDDSEWLDDPEVCALQPQNAAAAALQQRSNGNRGANPSSRLPSIAKPDGVSADTHDLVLKTMRGGEQWGSARRPTTRWWPCG